MELHDPYLKPYAQMLNSLYKNMHEPPIVICKHEVFHIEPTNPDIDELVLNLPIRCADCQWTGLVVLGEKVWDGVIYAS